MKNGRRSRPNLPSAESSRANAGWFRKGTHWRPHVIFREKPYLEGEYLGKGRIESDIAAEHGVTENAILFWLTKHAIPRRTMREVRQRKYWGATGAQNPMHGRCGAQNPRWIDGSSPERQRLYAQSFWKELVRE